MTYNVVYAYMGTLVCPQIACNSYSIWYCPSYQVKANLTQWLLIFGRGLCIDMYLSTKTRSTMCAVRESVVPDGLIIYGTLIHAIIIGMAISNYYKNQYT